MRKVLRIQQKLMFVKKYIKVIVIDVKIKIYVLIMDKPNTINKQ